MGISISVSCWHCRLIIFLQPSLLSPPWTDKTPKQFLDTALFFFTCGIKASLAFDSSLFLLVRPTTMLFSTTYTKYVEDALSSPVQPLLTLAIIPQMHHCSCARIGLLVFLQTVPLSFKLSSIIPTGEIFFERAAQMPPFPLWILQNVPSEIWALPLLNHTTKIYLNLCTWRYIPGLCYVLGVPYKSIQILCDWLPYPLT